MIDIRSWRERIEDELRQAEEEGLVVDELRERLRTSLPFDESTYRTIAHAVKESPRRQSLWDEPNDWLAIRRSLEEPPKPRPLPDRLESRLHAAWLGQAVGCMMGSPVAGWNPKRIRHALERDEAWPLDDYIPVATAPNRMHLGRPLRDYCRGEISSVLPHHDLAYAVLALRVLEAEGRGLSSTALADAWRTRLPAEAIQAAERVALDNLDAGLEPPEAAIHMNPYREWGGAQARAAVWGWAAPSDPLRAAEFAHRDASISHAKNGQYGALFTAAAVAAAFHSSDPAEVIDAGVRCIPPGSRLADAILETVRWAEEDGRWENTQRRMVARYGRYHWTHAIPNTLMTLIALLHGRGSFRRTVSIAVMAGFDASRNAAIAGSIAGLLYGRDAIPAHLTEPLGDRLETYVIGEPEHSLRRLAVRTTRVARDLYHA